MYLLRKQASFLQYLPIKKFSLWWLLEERPLQSFKTCMSMKWLEYLNVICKCYSMNNLQSRVYCLMDFLLPWQLQKNFWHLENYMIGLSLTMHLLMVTFPFTWPCTCQNSKQLIFIPPRLKLHWHSYKFLLPFSNLLSIIIFKQAVGSMSDFGHISFKA